MLIIVGLGNPGRKYKNTRHNLGFQVIDEFAEENNFPEFKFSKKSKSLISEKVFNNEKIILAKPKTFMNESGKAVKRILKNRDPGLGLGLCVVHDDIDFPLGKIKVVKNRGAAGHRGVESIVKELGTKNFVRCRLGIKNQEARIKNVEHFVLQKFDKEEEKIIKQTRRQAASELKTLSDYLKK